VTPIETAQVLLACLKTRLDGGPKPIADEHVCLRFGQEVNPSLGTGVDECCTGLAWVRVVTVTGLDDPSDPARNVCTTTQRRLTLEMGTARCIPFGTVEAPPTCDQWTEAALQMDADHQAMEAAICCFIDAVEAMPFAPFNVAVTDYQPFGPDGNCLRGTLQLTIDYDCGCGS